MIEVILRLMVIGAPFIIFLIGCFIVWMICISNKLNRSIVKIDEASSGIDIALTKRYDILTKMIETVKGYTKYEQETIFKTVELRKGMTIQEKIDANEKIASNLSKINLLAENYPNLKANENFKVLQQSIADVEEHLQAARRLYNANVSAFNQRIVSFPSSVIANLKGLTKRDFFVTDDIKKQDVNISF